MLFQMLCGEVPFKGSSIPSIMKKHLTSDVPSLQSKGAEVPHEIEAVVRHALEKEASHRTQSADDFARELREAMSMASAHLKRTGDSSASIDPSKTLVSASPASQTVPPGGTTAFDPHAGTISAASLAEEDHKTLFAQRELAREAAAKKKFAEEEEKKRQEEEAEKQKDRKQLEEIVAAQTKVLEEKLTQLASTMTPKPGATGVIDPESTQIQRAGMTTGGDVSFPGTSAHPFPRMDVSMAPKKSSALPIVLVVLLVLLIGGGVGGYLLLKSKNTGTTTGPGTTNDPGEIAIKADLIDIPGGKFQMGRNDTVATEAPAHEVTVKGFQMDKNEVTNAEYGQFVRQTNHAPPAQWGSPKPPVGLELLPVNNVSYDDALAFAEWRSKRDGATYRLPTEEEWEYAARNGEQDTVYPWGNKWEDGRAATAETRVGKEQPVGTYPLGANRWGVQDLMGNVWEWTSSKASLYKGNSLELPAQNKDWIVARGGSYSSTANKVYSSYRDWFAPNYKNPVLGFRLVKVSS
jgi:formylglycine-generating enzyme required for sulfatase activity